MTFSTTHTCRHSHTTHNTQQDTRHKTHNKTQQDIQNTVIKEKNTMLQKPIIQRRIPVPSGFKTKLLDNLYIIFFQWLEETRTRHKRATSSGKGFFELLID